jgi:replicative superfamily II helicase
MQTYSNLKKLFNVPEKYALNDFQEHFYAEWEKNKDANYIVAYPTSSGKSSSIFFLGNIALDDNKKVIYTAPTKALLEEKQDDFKEYGGEDSKWSNIGVVTGDYGKEEKTNEVLLSKDIICISQESLVSHIRRVVKSGNTGWFQGIGLVVIDEGHLVADTSRGANLEVAIFELLALLPHVQVLFISGTLKNSEHFVQWFGNISARTPVLITGTYRPHINKHVFVKYRIAKGKEGEDIKTRIITDIVNKHTALKEKGVVPVFKKAYGKHLVDVMRKDNIRSEFHFGDLDYAKRKSIEKLYKGGHLDALKCTQTLFVGLNLDADYGVISDAVVAGGDIPAYQVQQAAGRVGRYAPGTVYYLVPDNDDYDRHVERFMNGEDIMSTLLDYRQLLTHILGGIYSGWIKNEEQLVGWYERSLACVQGMLPGSKLIDAVEKLRLMGYVAIINETYAITHKGKICSQYMMCPLDVYDWVRNLRKYYALIRPTSTDLACAYGEVSRFYSRFISVTENKAIPVEVRKKSDGSFWKGVTPIYCRLKGLPSIDLFYSQSYSFYSDSSRIRECLGRVNKEIERWTSEEQFSTDFLKLLKGENSKELGLHNVKMSLADKRRLNAVGINTLEDARKNRSLMEQYGIDI